MGIVQKDAFRTMVISYFGIGLGYINKGFLFLLILSTEEIGLINLMLSIGLLFAQFANLGNTYITWKFLPFFKNEVNKHNGFFPFLLLIVLIGILVTTIALVLLRSPIESYYEKNSGIFSHYFFWVLPIGIGQVIFLSIEAYLRGFYKNIISVLANEVILRLALTTILILYWSKAITFDNFVIFHSIIYLLPCIVLLLYMKQKNYLNLSVSSIKISKKFKRILLDYASFNYINSLGAVLVSSLDVIMIASMVGLEATGVYATVVFLTSAVQVPYRSMLRISSPLVAEYWKHREMDKMKDLYIKVSSTGLFIGLSLFTIIWLNIDFLFSFLKEEFKDGIWVFFFLMVGRLIDMFFGLNGAIFSTSKKFKYDLIFTIILIGLVYGLNLWFIPIWGIVGAAISTALALVVYNLGRIVFVWRIFRMHPFTKNQFVIIFLGIITILVGGFCSKFMDQNYFSVLIHFLIFLCLFVLPIYRFNLEPTIKDYFYKIGALIKSKLLKIK